MINLVVEPYCHDCTDFEPEVEKSSGECNNKVLYTNTYITCEHRNKCMAIKSYLLTKGSKE